MIMNSGNFIFNFTNFCIIISLFLIKLLTVGILFSTLLRAVVAKLITLGILFLIPFILALRVVFVAEIVLSSILSSIF